MSRRSKNPLNVDQVPSIWLGSVGTDERGHAIFIDEPHGWRCGFMNLHSAWLKGKRCVADITGMWAPPPENDTGKYIKFICDRMLVTPYEDLHLFAMNDGTGKCEIDDWNNLMDLVYYMAWYENDEKYVKEMKQHHLLTGLAMFARKRLDGLPD